MNRTFFIILISIFLFIGINTVFYFTIFNQQLDFQTDLLARQTRLCGSTIEQGGLNFENELNAIPFADDFTDLKRSKSVEQKICKSCIQDTVISSPRSRYLTMRIMFIV